ncbi:MAG: type II toxin-antitoxin system death-on-curing family toxin [Deltaproteobacteria bacterium]|nr:type II toxin-antitoxin system death-on-curing family toxin [Deltaproteobacteria bacterium]
MNCRWVDINVVLAVHEQQISEHGGLQGIRDLGMIESALGRPQNFQQYNDPDLFDLVAAYGFGLARNHGFIDGNKRTAYVVTRLFLVLNGQDIRASAVEKVIMFAKVAKCEIDQAGLSSWLRSHSIQIHPA